MPSTGEFECSYDFNGKKRSIEINASSWEEAEERVKAIRQSLVLDGEIHEKIEV